LKRITEKNLDIIPGDFLYKRNIIIARLASGEMFLLCAPMSIGEMISQILWEWISLQKPGESHLSCSFNNYKEAITELLTDEPSSVVYYFDNLREAYLWVTKNI
jgi:hypothetical protein